MYGKQALDYIHENSRTVGLVLGLLVLAGGVGVLPVEAPHAADLNGRTDSRPKCLYNGDFDEP